MHYKRSFITLLLAALLSPMPVFAAEGLAPDAVEAKESTAALPLQELTPKVLYQFLLAEIAFARGQSGVAAAAYADLAKTTRDPRIARRASGIAYYARQPQLAVDAAQLWVESDPTSVEAKQAYWVQLAALGKTDQLADSMAKVIVAEAPQQGPALIQLGRLLARSEDKKMAARVVDKITAPYLSLPEAHFVRAQAAYGLGDNALTGKELDLALALKPDWEPAAILKAQLMAADPKASIDALAAFVKQHPNAREARVAYARALIEGKRYDEARAEFSSMLAADPERPDLLYSSALLSLQAGDAKTAEKYFQSILGKQFAEMDSVHFYLGQIAEESGRMQEAIDHYDAVAAETQHFMQAQTRAASAQARAGQQGAALERLRALELAMPKERNSVRIMQAQVLASGGDHDAAYKLLAAALQNSPDDADLLYETAMYAERLGKVEVLERHLRRAIKVKPDFAHAYNALGYSFADRNQNLDEANALIDKALTLQPDDPAILDSKGWVSYRRGDLVAAEAMLQKALAVRTDPEIAAHLGEVQWRMGREDEAKKTWNDALKAAPGNVVLNGTIKRFQQ